LHFDPFLVYFLREVLGDLIKQNRGLILNTGDEIGHTSIFRVD